MDTSDSSQQGSAPVETSEALNAAIDAATAAPVEAAPPTPTVPEPSVEEQKFAAKFAALSRKEKQLRAREREMEARLKQFESSSQSKEKELEGVKNLPERLKKDPLGVMKELGLTYEQLTEMVLNDGKPTQDMHLKEAMSPIEKKLADLEAKLAEKEAKEQEERLNSTKTGFMKSLKDFVGADPVAYEMIEAEAAHDLVYDVIERHYNQKMAEYQEEFGEAPDVETANTFILSNKVAADAVEKYLLDNAKKLVERNKVKSFLQPTPAQSKPQPGTQVGTKTLSNTASTTVPQKSSKYLSDEESKAQAASLIRWDD